MHFAQVFACLFELHQLFTSALSELHMREDFIQSIMISHFRFIFFSLVRSRLRIQSEGCVLLKRHAPRQE